jgi:hypothetical protein
VLVDVLQYLGWELRLKAACIFMHQTLTEPAYFALAILEGYGLAINRIWPSPIQAAMMLICIVHTARVKNSFGPCAGI